MSLPTTKLLQASLGHEPSLVVTPCTPVAKATRAGGSRTMWSNHRSYSTSQKPANAGRLQNDFIVEDLRP
jgi:hypothetical protein